MNFVYMGEEYIIIIIIILLLLFDDQINIWGLTNDEWNPASSGEEEF